MSLEQQINEFSSAVIQAYENGEAGQRELAQALELIAQLDDYYSGIQEHILENGLSEDYSVTVKAEGKVIKFSNIDQVAEWMTNGKLS